MIPVVIEVDGVDITDDVERETCIFQSQVNGTPGPAKFRLKDTDRSRAVVSGKRLTCDVGGIRQWDGYVSTVRRGYYFDGMRSLAAVPRYLEVTGVDLNILFSRRFLHDKVVGTKVQLTTYPAGTDDDTIILYYLENHLDLDDDDIDSSGVEHVGTPAVDSPISGAAGWSWGDFMRFMDRNTGAIFYLDPDRVLRHVDTDVVTADITITDQPLAVDEIGGRDFELADDGSKMVNDALIWGTGQGVANVRFARTTDATSIADHGRWQQGLFTPQMYKLATVQRVADSYVNGSPANRRGGKDPQPTARWKLFEPLLRPGQVVPVVSRVFGWEYNLPIRSMRLTFPKGVPEWEFIASHETDQPWATFEWAPFTGIHLPGLQPFPPITLPPFPPLPPFDPCLSPGTCIEGFGRIEASTWGTSDFGPDWQMYQYVGAASFDPDEICVDGANAVVTATDASFDPAFGAWIDAGAPVAFPQEVLIAFSIRWCRDGDTIEYDIGWDGAPDPVSSSDWCHVVLRPFETPTGSPYPYDEFLEIGLDDSPGGSGAADDDSYAMGSVSDASTYVETDAYLRMRIDDTGFHAKLWPQSGSEPGSWTIEDLDWDPTTLELPFYSFYYMQADGGSDAPSKFSVDSIEIVEGCPFGGGGGGSGISSSTCWEDTLERSIGVSYGSDRWGTSDPGDAWDTSTVSLVADEGGLAGVESGYGVLRSFFDGGTPNFFAQVPIACLAEPWEILALVEASSTASVESGVTISLNTGSSLSASITWDRDSSGYRQIALSDGAGVDLPRSDLAYDVRYWVRWRHDTENDFAGLKVWEDGNPEPDWDLTTTTTPDAGGDFFFSTFPFIASHGDGAHVDARLHDLQVFGGDPCSGPTPPPPDLPTGEGCTDGEPMDPPPSPDPDVNYYNVGGPYQPGSSEVYLNGVFLRPVYDYYEDYVHGWVLIQQSVDVGPDHNVRFCAFFESVLIA